MDWQTQAKKNGWHSSKEWDELVVKYDGVNWAQDYDKKKIADLERQLVDMAKTIATQDEMLLGRNASSKTKESALKGDEERGEGGKGGNNARPPISANSAEGEPIEIGDHMLCPKCHSDMFWEDCEECGGEGVDGHECGEDTCCCLEPDDNVECGRCEGRGGWYRCDVCLNKEGARAAEKQQPKAEWSEEDVEKVAKYLVEYRGNEEHWKDHEDDARSLLSSLSRPTEDAIEISVLDTYRGIFPEPVLSHLKKAGWHHKTECEKLEQKQPCQSEEFLEHLEDRRSEEGAWDYYGESRKYDETIALYKKTHQPRPAKGETK